MQEANQVRLGLSSINTHIHVSKLRNRHG
jgi:hypothetical protein